LLPPALHVFDGLELLLNYLKSGVDIHGNLNSKSFFLTSKFASLFENID
jgi:hypothetical protein